MANSQPPPSTEIRATIFFEGHCSPSKTVKTVRISSLAPDVISGALENLMRYSEPEARRVVYRDLAVNRGDI